MKVAVIGSGGREHTLCWKLGQSKLVDGVYCLPGNAGTAQVAENVVLEDNSIRALTDFVKEKDIGLTVVGPEAPLVEGIVDDFEKQGLNVFGPSKRAAVIEGSKIFTRELLQKYGIPNAEFASFDNAEKAKDYLHEKGAPIVVKADGLAAGKGAIVCETIEEAESAINKIMVDNAFGEAGRKIVLEEKLLGEEASYLVFTDGETIKPMASSQDHKPVYDGGKGPNCYSMDTEILTEEGWKTFDKLKGEKVYAFDKRTKTIRLEKPKEIHWMKYNGKMINFKHRLLDLLVTPNHRMLVEKRKTKKIHVYEAWELGGENNIFLNGKWQGKDKRQVTLEEYDCKFNRKLKEQKIPFTDWVKFLAIYLSEGYTAFRKNEKRVFVCQTKKSKHFSKIEKIISKLPFNYTYSDKEHKFRINSIQLALELKRFGTSHHKFIPNYLKNASKETILEFLKVYNMGDGDNHYGKMRFCTASKQMADDLQELILKAGYAGIITKDKRKTMINPINKKRYKASPVYSIEITKRQRVGIRKKDIHKINYVGYVGCVTVPSGFVVARRNNRIAISGNTGGMGAYSPAPVVTRELEEEVLEKIMQPTVDAMKKEGREYKGVLYGGLMITKNGPKVVEFNCRFGDPETQALLPRLESDLVPIMQACIDGTLTEQEIKWSEKAACCVVMASGGYPGSYEKGKEIFGLREAAATGAVVFHAGTRLEKDKVFTNGGRVLGVTALGGTIKESIENAYNAVEKISFEKAHYRKDIGQKALGREQ